MADALSIKVDGQWVGIPALTGFTSTEVTIPSALWLDNTASVKVDGLKADSKVFVSPSPASMAQAIEKQMYCSAVQPSQDGTGYDLVFTGTNVTSSGTATVWEVMFS